MADPSLLMNNELPVNGIGFPMPSAGMAFSNGPDMQGKVLPQASPYGYPMFGVGAPGDMAGAHMPGVNQMAQVRVRQAIAVCFLHLGKTLIVDRLICLSALRSVIFVS